MTNFWGPGGRGGQKRRAPHTPQIGHFIFWLNSNFGQIFIKSIVISQRDRAILGGMNIATARSLNYGVTQLRESLSYSSKSVPKVSASIFDRTA